MSENSLYYGQNLMNNSQEFAGRLQKAPYHKKFCLKLHYYVIT